MIQTRFGLFVQFRVVSAAELVWLTAAVASAWLASLVAGYRAYRMSLALISGIETMHMIRKG